MLLVKTICVMFLVRISEANYDYGVDYNNDYQLGKLKNATQWWEGDERIALRQSSEDANQSSTESTSQIEIVQTSQVTSSQEATSTSETETATRIPDTTVTVDQNEITATTAKITIDEIVSEETTKIMETEKDTEAYIFNYTITTVTPTRSKETTSLSGETTTLSEDTTFISTKSSNETTTTGNLNETIPTDILNETLITDSSSKTSTLPTLESSTETFTTDHLTETSYFTESFNETITDEHYTDTTTSYFTDSFNETITNEYYIDTTTEVTTMGKPAVLDLPALMNLIMNLTGEFETNLTNKLNESLQRMSLPTCGTPTFEPPTTSEYDANYTGSIVAKCFVCGLDVQRVPIHAHCADAFAGDFLPLVPVDPTARAQISKYRKYCKYSNTPGYMFNTTQPRAIFGRWTGGCAVRWIDLSGIYTQRVCRSRLQPIMGRHFASKRMAKLEKALWNVDNGCIVSPMATLVPLSRGISLYARFHACVCSGNWCNTAEVNKKVNTFSALVAIPLVYLLESNCS